MVIGLSLFLRDYAPICRTVKHKILLAVMVSSIVIGVVLLQAVLWTNCFNHNPCCPNDDDDEYTVRPAAGNNEGRGVMYDAGNDGGRGVVDDGLCFTEDARRGAKTTI